MTRQVVFILSDMRSGSTLLDQLLGASPGVVSVGEIHWLPAYALQDRRAYDPGHALVCTCGASVQECTFWSQVALQISKPISNLELRPRLTPLGKRFIAKLPAAFRFRKIQRLLTGSALSRDNLELLDAVSKISGCDTVVDSSKSPLRFRSVLDARPAAVRALVLVRDVRAVVYSKMKRGTTLESAARGWKHRMRLIDALTRDLPDTVVNTITYEHLCDDPAGSLTGICQFLGIEFSDQMFRRHSALGHQLGGSPSKHDLGRIAIRRDIAFEQALSPVQVARIRSLVGGIPARWGY